MISLGEYGWSPFHQHNFISSRNPDESAGRVLSVKGFKYHLTTENGDIETELSGRLMYSADHEELPKVGDWVTFLNFDESGYITGVLPRRNELARKTPGRQSDRQVLATNVDVALIVQGMDQNFNLMRLDRYITQAAACHITPVVVLNKADLVTDQEVVKVEVQRLKRDCPVFFVSTLTGMGIEALNVVLEKGRTFILIGSSGVGKSSLLNVLMKKDVQKTNLISDAVNKGKHTTTTRDLFKLPNGSLVIDTPGMREFGLTADHEFTDSLFPLLDELGGACKYADCTHRVEAGCAVIAAVHSGELDPLVYESYVKLVKEQKRFTIRAEDKKRLNKQFGRMTREARNYRKKYKS